MNRIALLLFPALYLFWMPATAQKKSANEKFYLWKKDWTSTPKADSAAFMGIMKRTADTCWQLNIYNYAGPMISSEEFKDEQASVRHGEAFYYHASGYIDSTGRYLNGVPENDWNYCDDTGAIVLRKAYSGGKLISEVPVSWKDSTREDSVKHDEKESEFRGGSAGWQRYLIKHLEYPQRALNLGIKGKVVAQFVVDKEGKTNNIRLFKSVEYSIDETTIALIRDSPTWTPATMDGQVVKSYKRQPLIYRY